jgi:arylsulfatase A-like enzyme
MSQRVFPGVDRRTFLKRTGAAGLAAAVGRVPVLEADTPGTKRPNVLFVFSDQHRASALGCSAAGEEVRTPSFDGFAGEGTRFANAVSNTPVCCPARASLMTGKYGHHTGVVTNRVYPEPGRHRYLAEVFRASGYRCGYVGKWHLGEVATDPGDPRRLGFHDYWYGGRQNSSHFRYNFAVDSADSISGDCFFRPKKEADLAVDFLGSQSSAEPWFLFLSWTAPHPPFTSPNKYLQHYDRKPLTFHDHVEHEFSREVADLFLPHYYGLIEGLDTEFGRLLAELDRLGMRDDTIVVYTSDHGEMLGCHDLMGKRWPYRESTNVPLIFQWPGRIPAGVTPTTPFGMPDIMPTLLGLAGIEAPAGLDGNDHSELLLGHSSVAVPDHAYLAMHYGFVPWPGWRGVRTKRYVYARLEERPWLLFDLENDPLEQRNLVTENSPLVKDFDGLTLELMKTLGDSWRGLPEVADWKKWAPGGPGQLQQFAGGDYPGRQPPDVPNWRDIVLEKIKGGNPDLSVFERSPTNS